MSNRSRLFLSLFLALPYKVSAQSTAIQVQVYDYVGLEPSTLSQFVARIQDTLITAGLSVHVEACTRGIEDPCAAQTGSARRLLVRVLAGAPKRMSNVGRPTLGESFADHDGGTYASVFLDQVQDEAAKANVPRVIVLAYAAVHEIGHLLLGDQAHTPRGVMKAQWDRNDYQAMVQNHFHFASEQLRILANHYGVSRTADAGPDSRVAGTR